MVRTCLEYLHSSIIWVCGRCSHAVVRGKLIHTFPETQKFHTKIITKLSIKLVAHFQETKVLHLGISPNHERLYYFKQIGRLPVKEFQVKSAINT